MSERKLIILTEGHSDPHTAKTGCCIIRYRREEVVGVLDGTLAGQQVSDYLGVGDDLKFISSIDDALEANCLLIGIAPPGGKIPDSWRPIVLRAIECGMNVVSGLHDFVTDDAEFVAAAQQHQVELVDVRKNDFTAIARRPGFRKECFRVHTVGHDCSIGKMVTAVEITEGLKERGVDAKFCATGQTGIMIEGSGYPMDRVIADFISGAAEQLVLENEQHDVLLIEGQGSLVHPSYSAVTLGILHGSMPHALVLCYEVLRDKVTGVEHVAIAELPEIRKIVEVMSNVHHRCDVIGVSMNSRRVTEEEAKVEQQRVSELLGLPVTDVFRFGREPLVDAVIAARDRYLESVADETE